MSAFKQDVVAGLSESPRWLPCKYLYDAKGSELFEQICDTDDYYVTRADLEIHQNQIAEVAELIGTNAHIIEFGSGSGIKTELLLDSLKSPRAYTPIEISKTALDASVAQLEKRFEDLEVQPLQADYTEDIDPSHLSLEPTARRRVIYFPGSTIGNFTHDQAQAFLVRMRRMAGDNGLIFIGVDLIKPVNQLLRAYDDSAGVTARFNTNVLQRMRDELGAQIDMTAFAHESRFNRDLQRVEMHLVAQTPTTITIDEDTFAFGRGESIHTESSHKYSIGGFQDLAKATGLTPVRHWLDSQTQFSMHCLEPA